MPSTSVSAQFWVLLLVIINLVAIITYVIFVHVRARHRQRQVALVNATILDYFRRSGVAVAVCSINLLNNKRFTALVESEPMKRFRLSHIIEMTLREHIVRICGLELEKIYWRFPIKEATQNAATADTGSDQQAAKSSDEYINEGLVHYRDLPKVDVSEIPWEKFEEVVMREPDNAAEPETVASDAHRQ